MENGCVVCKRGVDVLAQKLLTGDYNKLEDLGLCTACRMKLVESVNRSNGPALSTATVS